MSKVAWNKPGERRYETGVDRGVLYLADGSGVPWNGLTSVDEDLSDVATTPYFFDGIKYMDTRYPGDYSGSLKAYTYPDEFLPFDGYAELNNGVLLGHQPVYDRFGLSYRTLIGNDVDGLSKGYKIHILYNLVATPDNRSYPTVSNQPSPEEFSWKLTGVPEAIPGYRPTVHIILDTTKLNPFLIADVERILYGQDQSEVSDPDVIDGGRPGTYVVDGIDGNVSTPLTDGGDITITGPTEVLDGGSPFSSGVLVPTIDFDYLIGGTPSNPGGLVVRGGTPESPFTRSILLENLEPKLPPLSELVELLDSWVLIDVVDNGDGSWSATGPSDVVSLIDNTSFEIRSSSARYIDEDTYEISTTHTF